MAVPDWLNGADLSSVTAQQVKDDLTTGLTYDITGYTVSIPMEQRADMEDVRPINSLQHNMVTTGIGDYMTLECFQNRTAANSKMAAILANRATYPLLLMTFVLGELTYQAIFRIAGFRPLGVNRRAGNTVSVDLVPVDVGYSSQSGVAATGSTATTQGVIHGLP